MIAIGKLLFAFIGLLNLVIVYVFAHIHIYIQLSYFNVVSLIHHASLFMHFHLFIISQQWSCKYNFVL